LSPVSPPIFFFKKWHLSQAAEVVRTLVSYNISMQGALASRW